MFSKSVIDTERFYSLPIEAQALYFHLGINADVQGFVEPMKIARLVGIKIEALKPLIDKKFVIPFQSGVVVITEWHINNTVRETHEAPSQYTKERESIILLEQGIYQLQENYCSTTVELPQSIVKDSIVKSREEKKKEKSYKEELNNELLNLCMESKKVLGKSFKNTKALMPNYSFWRNNYSANEIIEALRKSRFSDYWQDKITLEILLRQRDTKGNAVDRIGEFLALEEKQNKFLALEDF